MLFPLESISHLPHSNISALDHDYLLAAGDAARAHATTFSDDANHQPGLDLGLALSLAFVVNTITDARAHRDIRAGHVAVHSSRSRRPCQAFGARG